MQKIAMSVMKRQMLLSMKFLFLFILVTSLQVNAKLRSQTISYSAKGVSLEKVLAAIKKQTGYVFFYTSGILESAKPVTVDLKNVSIDKALEACFKEQPLTYLIKDKTVLIKEKSLELQSTLAFQALPPPPIIITGKVVDDKGVPLVSASVQIKGTVIGTITNDAGNFSLSSPKNAGILVISYTGFIRQEIPFSGNTDLSIKLLPSLDSTEDVVVVGYGTTKKIHLTGAVASIGGDKLENRPIVNIADGLQGLLPGLNINLNGGQPGMGASFNIRGLSIINGNSANAGGASPLILVDGVERDPNLIDPNDVANVTVLKDAASSTIYGGRAAYGVILITTKKGKSGPPQLAYTGSYTISRPTNLPNYVDSKGYLTLFNSAQNTGSISGGATSSGPFTATDSTKIMAYYNDPSHNPDAYVDPTNPNLYRYVGNTDWIKVLYPGWAPMQQHNLSLSGGTDRLSYVASMGYFRQEGLEKVANQIYQRYTPSVKLTSKVTDWLSMDLNMSLTHTDNNQPSLTTIAQGNSWIPGDLRPTMPVYNPDGHFSGQGSYTNPVAVMTLSGRDKDQVNDFWTTARATITPVKHVTWVTDYTWNSYSENDKANVIPYNEYGVNGYLIGQFAWTKTPTVSEYRTNNTYYAFNSYITYENTFAQKHYLKAMVGYNQEYRHYNNLSVGAINIINPALGAINLNTDPKPSVNYTGSVARNGYGTYEAEYALIGTFYRVNYAFKDKYLVELDGRYDGTSRFQPGHQYVFSPSVSAGWDVTKESFMKNIRNTVNQLKLRVSYGNLPNQKAPNYNLNFVSIGDVYPTVPLMGTGTTGYLFNNQPGVTINTPGITTAALTWEKLSTWNYGIDYAFLKNRLSGSFDYFITHDKNILVNGLTLPALLGTNVPLRNSGELKTSGWELNLSWKDKLMNGKFTYGITLNLWDAVTTVQSFPNNSTQLLAKPIAGRKLGEIWGYTTEGFYKTDAEAQAVDNSALANYKWLAGDIKFKDVNGDGKINYGQNTLSNHGDLAVIGNSQLRYKYGVTLSLGYAGFDFTAFFQGLLKGNYDPTGQNPFHAFASNEYSIPYATSTNFWTPQNTNAYFPRPRFGGGDYQTQTKYLQNMAYLRMKQLTLGYSFSQAIINKLKIKRLRVYITGANLFTITSLFKGFDPDAIIAGYTNYPLNRSLSAGVQVGL